MSLLSSFNLIRIQNPATNIAGNELDLIFVRNCIINRTVTPLHLSDHFFISPCSFLLPFYEKPHQRTVFNYGIILPTLHHPIHLTSVLYSYRYPILDPVGLPKQCLHRGHSGQLRGDGTNHTPRMI